MIRWWIGGGCAAAARPWRPLLHVEDACQAYIALLEAPREAVHGRAFNVGRDDDNYRILDLAEMVAEAVPGSRVKFADHAGSDARSYRVSFGRIASTVPGFRPRWTVRDGIEQLLGAFCGASVTLQELHGARFTRVERLRELIGEGHLDSSLRWRAPVAVVPR